MAIEHVKWWCWKAHGFLLGNRLSLTQHPTHNNSTSASFFLFSLRPPLHSWTLQSLTQSQVEAVHRSIGCGGSKQGVSYRSWQESHKEQSWELEAQQLPQLFHIGMRQALALKRYLHDTRDQQEWKR